MQDLLAYRKTSLSSGTTFQMGQTKNQANEVCMQPKDFKYYFKPYMYIYFPGMYKHTLP